MCELPVAAVPSHLGGGTSRQVPGKTAHSSLQMSAPGCLTKCLLHHTPATRSASKRRSLRRNDVPFLTGHTPEVSDKVHEELHLPFELRGILGLESAGD